jgi:hypothetical protein
MNPNDPAPVSNPVPAIQPVVDFVCKQRQNVAYLFLGLSVLCLIATIFLATRAFKAAPADPTKTEEKKADEEKPPIPELPKAEAANPKKPSYMVGWIGGLFAFLITATVGAYLQVMPPKTGSAAQQREARVLLLAAGGLLGAALILFGGAYFYLWSDSIIGWLDKGEIKEMKWVIIPLLMVAAGGGLVFAAVQPARAEERNDSGIRRLVYGSNFAVTVLLLFVVLIVLNVVVGMKVPNQLDTTETGFYTLSNSTREFLGKLAEPATLYVIMPESGDRIANDIRQFAYTAQDAADGKLNVKFVSPVSNKTELARLQEKYPRLGRDSLGVLITAGDDEKRSAFVSIQDIFDVDPRTGRMSGFAGEAKVMKELRFLADNEQKAVIYFTQSNGELSIAGGAPGENAMLAGSTANTLKAYLERNYFDVRPLTFTPKTTAVPADASVVIVAEPVTALSPAAVDALRKYMSSNKGKLIVLAGAAPGPNDKGIAKTGLEPLLAEFNVRLGEKFLYAEPSQEIPRHNYLLVRFNPKLDNPVAQQFARMGLLFENPREVSPIQGGNPQFQAAVLMYSPPGRPTWLEDDRLALNDVNRVIKDMNENEAVQTRKNLSDGPRMLAVVVSEGGAPSPHGGPPPAAKGRLMVIGNSSLFSDAIAERMKNPPLDIIGTGIEWLRDRPPLASEAEVKKYKEYQPPEPASVDTTRLVYLPLGLALLLVTGFGTGVWVMRRK